MPLLLDRKIDNHSRVAVWKVTEDPSFFLGYLDMTKKEAAAYKEMRPHRQKEWLSSRYLLHLISEDSKRRKITKTKTGKPERVNCPRYISISHSKEYTAVIISEKRTGLDIQKPEKKISRIAHKFISKEEALRIDELYLQDYYHIFWGAKEAMYKAYGLKKLEFRHNMHLFPFIVSGRDIELKGYVDKGAIHQQYDLWVHRLEKTYLVVALLDKEKDL